MPGGRMPGARARGQHAGLTRASVLAAAVRLVDEQGLSGLSMRRLGAALGVEAMALYHHVGSKDDLLDGLVEHLFAEVVPVLDEVPSPAEDWRAPMRAFARAMLQTLLDHPQLVPVVLSRPATTPPVHSLLERVLTTLQEAGLPPGRSLDLVYALIGFVVAHVATGGDAGSTSARRQVLAGQDLTDFPLLAAAVREESAPGATPFDVTLEALLAWFDPS